MKVRVEVVSLNADGDEQRRQVLMIERRELAMETLGINLTEGKALLADVQDFVVAQQAREELEQRRACPHCRRRYTTKDSGSTPVSTVHRHPIGVVKARRKVVGMTISVAVDSVNAKYRLFERPIITYESDVIIVSYNEYN